MMKRTLCFLLAAVMLLTLLPGQALAADTYTITVNYVYRGGKLNGSPAASSHYATIAAGTGYENTLPNPQIPGYAVSADYTATPGITVTLTASGLTYSVVNIEADQTVTVYYEPAASTYEVRYFQQNVDNDNYTLVETETKTGVTESKINVVPKEYEGFTRLPYDEETVVAADNSTVVEIYYDRNYYLMTFDLDGGYGVEPIYDRYGAPIQVSDPTRPGYTFSGWNVEIPATMPAQDTKGIKALWNAGTARLTVVYWYENADDDGYSYAGSVKKENYTVGQIVSSASFRSEAFDGRDDEHFTYNAAKVESQTVAGDGSTVLNVYFTRNQYLLIFIDQTKGSSTYTECLQHKEEHTHYPNSCYELTCEISHTHSPSCFYSDTVPAEVTPERAFVDAARSMFIDKDGKDAFVNGYIYNLYSYRKYSYTTSTLRDEYYLYLDNKWYPVLNSTYISNLTPVMDGEDYYGWAYASRSGSNYTDYDCVFVYIPSVYCGVTHLHNSNCVGELTCQLEEHIHTDSCYVTFTGTLYQKIWAKYQQKIIADWPLAGENYGYTTVPSNLLYWTYEQVLPEDTNPRQATKVYTLTENFCAPKGYNIITPTTGSNKEVTYEYWLESLDGTGTNFQGVMYELSDEFTQKVHVGSDSTGALHKYIDGFVYSDPDNSVSFVNGVAKLHYIRNRHNFTFQDGYGRTVVNGTNIPYQRVLGSLLVDEATPLADYVCPYPDTLEPNAYTFGGWYTTSDCLPGTEADFSTLTMPNRDMTFYAKWVPVEHNVTMYIKLHGDQYLSVIANIPHGSTVPADQIPADPTNGNYTFLGWFYLDENGKEKAFDFGSMPVNHDLEVYAKWGSKVPVPYTIHFVDENGNPVADDLTGTALAGATRTFDAKTGAALYEAFQEGWFPNVNSHSMVIDIESSNNVFTFVYKRMAEVPYTVRYLEKGTNVVLHEEKNVTDNTKAVVTEDAELITGYVPDSLQKRLILSSDPANNILIFYYEKNDKDAPYLISHYLADPAATTLYQQESGLARIGSTQHVKALNIPDYELDYVVVNGVRRDANVNFTETVPESGLRVELYYKPITFKVYYSSTQSTVKYHISEYTAAASFSTTARVHNGYLYGGMYTNSTFTTPLTTVGADNGSGLGFQPEAGRTYYVKEVPDTYLRNKTYTVYNKDNGELRQLYFLTAIDDKNYTYVGYDVIDESYTIPTMAEPVSTEAAEILKIQRITVNGLVDEGTISAEGNFKLKGFVNAQKYGYYTDPVTHLDYGTSLKVRPFFVTMDGVKVTGVQSRQISITAPEGSDLVGLAQRKDLTTTDLTADVSQVSKYLPNGTDALTISKTSSIVSNPEETPETPEVPEIETPFTVTKIYADTTEAQAVPAGSNVGAVTYAEREGEIFAGWYLDAKFTQAADFTDVQSDLTVYAKYVDVFYVTVSTTRKNNSSAQVEVLVPMAAFASVQTRIATENGEVTVDADYLGRTNGGRLVRTRSDRYQTIVDLGVLENGLTVEVTPILMTWDGTQVPVGATSYVYQNHAFLER